MVCEDQSYREAFTVCFLFLRWVRQIFAETILWSEDTPSKKEYVSQFKKLFTHLLLVNT